MVEEGGGEIEHSTAQGSIFRLERKGIYLSRIERVIGLEISIRMNTYVCAELPLPNPEKIQHS
jgi:hypothetical protein